jgi:16S rRNA (guanine527-N7)-methyltransferase
VADEVGSICGALGLAPTAQQTQSLLAYLDLLQRWNATYNLTAVRDRDAMLVQHLADCLAVVPPLTRQLRAGRLLDVGSGGGLPGVVLAIMLPAFEISCVDAVGKKAAFVQQVAATLALPNLRGLHARAEALKDSLFNIITSRAFASLENFTRLTQPLLAPGGAWMAMKGKRPDAEIAELPPHVQVFHVEQLDVPHLQAERCLVWLRPAEREPGAQ